MTISSIILSLYAIASKLIHDDSKVFIQQSGANWFFPPTWRFIARVLFRISEVSCNLFVLLIVSVYFGVFFAFFYLLFLICLNIILYQNGLLGEEWLNIFAYIFACINLGITPKHLKSQSTTTSQTEEQKNNICSIRVIKKIAANVYNPSQWLLCKKLMSKFGYNRLLSYNLIFSRMVQGLVLLGITAAMFFVVDKTETLNRWQCVICTDYNSRHANDTLFKYLIWITGGLYIIEFVTMICIFESLSLGFSLVRDWPTYLLNHQFLDGVRLLKMKHKIDRKDFSVNSYLKMIEIIFKWFNDANMILLNKFDYQLTQEQSNNYHYFVALLKRGDQIANEFKDTRVRFYFLKLFTDSVLIGNASFVSFIIANNLIEDICYERFDDGVKNLFHFIIANCSDRPDMIYSVIRNFSYYYTPEQMQALLLEKIGMNNNRSKSTFVVSLLVHNNTQFGKIIKYLFDNINCWQVLLESKVIEDIISQEYKHLVASLKFGDETTQAEQTEYLRRLFDYSPDLFDDVSESWIMFLKQNDFDLTWVPAEFATSSLLTDGRLLDDPEMKENAKKKDNSNGDSENDDDDEASESAYVDMPSFLLSCLDKDDPVLFDILLTEWKAKMEKFGQELNVFKLGGILCFA